MSADDRLVHPELLADEYGDDTSLRSRQSIYEFVDVAPPIEEVFERLPLPREGTLLDIGCGNGLWTLGMRTAHPRAVVVGIDRHRGMLDAMVVLDSPSGRVVGDAHTLPFADDSADVVMALWMLYHLADLPGALAELRRVVRRRGVLLAITNQPTHLAELHEILDAELAPYLDGAPGTGRMSDRFNGANGERILDAVFDDLEVVPLNGNLAITEPRAVVTYVESLQLALDTQLGVPVGWPEVMAGVEAATRDRIAATGILHVTTASIAYLARDL